MGIVDLVVLCGRIFYSEIGANCSHEHHMKLLWFFLVRDNTTKDLRKGFPSSFIRLAQNTLVQTAAHLSPELDFAGNPA